MNRRNFLQGSGALAAHLLSRPGANKDVASHPLSAADRGCVLCVDPRLRTYGQDLCESIVSAVHTQPLLATLSAGKSITQKDRTHAVADDYRQLAYNHVIVIGYSDDSLVKTVWQREAVISDRSIYAFGFGNLEGSIGYIESDRNPFVHGAEIPTIPFETQLVTITGTDQHGIGLAVQAFISQGLVNGLVAEAGWHRSSPTLLDRDPLTPAFQLPDNLPDSFSSLKRIALIQASEDEYRGVLADTGVEPLDIWRAKYYAPGVWDGAGIRSTFFNYAAGLHRRAYGNTAWIASFENPTQASTAATKIAAAAHLVPFSTGWSGHLPAFAWGNSLLGDSPIPGTLDLTCTGASLLMRTTLMPTS